MKAGQTAPVAATQAVEKPAEPSTELPDWLPPYPGTKPEGVSITTDPATGKRVGSFFFRTNDEREKVYDYYEDKMTRATWSLSRGAVKVLGGSESEGREFEVTAERRGDETRVRVEFDDKEQK